MNKWFRSGNSTTKSGAKRTSENGGKAAGARRQRRIQRRGYTHIPTYMKGSIKVHKHTH